MTKPTLGYWKIKGLAQPIRILLNVAKVDYTDKQYSDPKEWFEKDKKEMGIKMPNLPYFIDGDFSLTESRAIIFYVLQKYGLSDRFLGEDIHTRARVHQALGVMQDISRLGYVLPKEAPQEEKNKLFREKGQHLLRALLDRKTKFLVDDKLRLCDIVLAQMIDYTNLNFKDQVQKIKQVKQFQKLVSQTEEMKSYYSKADAITTVMW